MALSAVSGEKGDRQSAHLVCVCQAQCNPFSIRPEAKRKSLLARARKAQSKNCPLARAMRGKSPRTLFELARQTWLGSRASLERSIERLERNHLFQWLSASTAKAVAASDMNLPEWLAGSRFFTTDTLRHAPVAA